MQTKWFIYFIIEKCEIQNGYRTCFFDPNSQNEYMAKFYAQNFKQKSFVIYGLIFGFAAVIVLGLIVSNGNGTKK